MIVELIRSLRIHFLSANGIEPLIMITELIAGKLNNVVLGYVVPELV